MAWRNLQLIGVFILMICNFSCSSVSSINEKEINKPLFLQLLLECSKSTFKIGEIVPLKVTIWNEGKIPIVLKSTGGGSILLEYISLQVQTPSKRKYEYFLSEIPVIIDLFKREIILKPGVSYSETIEWNVFENEEPGEYQILGVSKPFLSHQLRNDSVVSNTIILTAQ